MKISADKWHLLVSRNDTVKIKARSFNITNSKSEKLLGVKFDHRLSFFLFQNYVKRLLEKFMRYQE